MKWQRRDSTTYFIKEHSIIEPNWPNDWAALLSVLCIWLYVIIMSRTSFRVNPHFVIFLDVKELLARSRRHIWSLSDSSEIRTYNRLDCKQTLNDLAKLSKWLSCAVSTYLYSTFDCMLFSCYYHARSSFTFRRIKKCGYTLKFVRETAKIFSEMHRTDKDSQHSSIIWTVYLNGWVFVYGLSDSGFESSCCHLNFRYGAHFNKGVPWHSGKLQSVNSLWNSYMIW